MAIKLPPIPTELKFNSSWVNWIFKLYEKQKRFIMVTETPEASVATPSTHKVKVVIDGQTYYLLVTNT